MAIRFRYDVPAVATAAYATGRGKARQRKQKYLMDMLQRRQGMQFQLMRDAARRRETRELLGLRGEQARGLQTMRGEQALELGFQRGRQAQELLKKRGIQAGELLEQRSLQQQELMEQAGEQRLEQERVRGEFDIEQEYLEGLRTGELVLPEAARAEMATLNAALVNMDRMGSDTPEALKQIRERKRELVRSAQPPAVPELTPVERARESTVLWDPDKRDYTTREDAGPNAFPVPLDDEGRPDWRNAQVPEGDAARREAHFKARENLIKAQQALAKTTGAFSDASAEEKKSLQAMVDLRQEELDALTDGQQDQTPEPALVAAVTEGLAATTPRLPEEPVLQEWEQRQARLRELARRETTGAPSAAPITDTAGTDLPPAAQSVKTRAIAAAQAGDASAQRFCEKKGWPWRQ